MNKQCTLEQWWTSFSCYTIHSCKVILNVERAGTAGIIIGVCYRLPDQVDQVNEALCRQIGAASSSLVLMEDFNHPHICWRNNTEGHKKSMKFLQCTADNFLLQVIEERTRWGAMLDLVLINKEALVGMWSSSTAWAAVTLKKSLGQGGGFQSKLTTLDVRRPGFIFFSDSLHEYHANKPWREEGPRKLINMQRFSPPGSRAMYPHE